MNSLQQQFSLDKKIVNIIHLLPTISVEGIMLYFPASRGKAEDLLRTFTLRIEQGQVIHIRGNLNLYNSSIKTLGNLQTVGGYLNLTCAFIKSLGKLQTIGGYMDLIGTSIKSLGDLQSVGGPLYLPINQIPKAELDKVQVGGEIIYF